MNSIQIGSKSLIGEDCVVHVAGGNIPGTTANNTIIGNNVLIGRLINLFLHFTHKKTKRTFCHFTCMSNQR